MLPDDLAAWVETDPLGSFRLGRPSSDELAALLEVHDVDWSVGACADRLVEDRKTFPASDAALSGAEERIDFDSLSFYDNRVVEAATAYGDVSGFTAFIDAATTQAAQKAALRAFHAVRREMAKVVQTDFEGVRVQFQGDRVQALFHLPEDDADGFSEEATRAAVGLQSSFELVLKDQIPALAELGIAVGVSQGPTIATKLGERAHRDRICLGDDVLRAERNEENVGKRQIGISGNVREHLPERLAKHFVWSDAANCYVVTGLDQGKLDLAEAATAIRKGTVYISSGVAGSVLRPDEHKGGRARVPSPSHAF
jgi:class 3 adenylate cyclase